MPEREFDVHVVKVEGSGGDEGTSQSSHVTECMRVKKRTDNRECISRRPLILSKLLLDERY
jgi:hypothetical protein